MTQPRQEIAPLKLLVSILLAVISGVIAITAGFLGWQVSTVLDVQDRVIRIEERLELLRAQEQEQIENRQDN